MTQAELDASYASVVPATVGALLAEEWTINPYSTLPSFLEMMFMEQADVQTRRALTSVMEALQHMLTTRRQRVLIRQQQQQQQQHQHQQQEHGRYPSSVHHASILKSLQTAIQNVEYRLIRLLENVLRHGSVELATLIYYLLQRQSLASASISATLSESIYGGRRVKVAAAPPLPMLAPSPGIGGGEIEKMNASSSSSTSSSQPQQKASLQTLARRDQTRLALLLALGPYVESKLNALHLHWNQQQHQQQRYQGQFGSGGAGSNAWKRRLFLILYPLARASIHGANWICQWRFLIGHSIFFNLSSFLLQQVVRRVTQQDKESPSSSLQSPSPSSSLSKSENTILPATSTTESATSSTEAGADNILAPQQHNDHTPQQQMVKSVVAVAAGALVVSLLSQLRAAYLQHQQERLLLAIRNAATALTATPNSLNNTSHHSEGANSHHHYDCHLGTIPPPPPPRTPARQTSKVTTTRRYPDQCPLCHARPRVQPAASSSGFVFCYKCILSYVRRHATCPMTQQPCSESRIVRLYEPQHS
jgi:Pex2 / Pex12 amino terminal region